MGAQNILHVLILAHNKNELGIFQDTLKGTLAIFPNEVGGFDLNLHSVFNLVDLSVFLNMNTYSVCVLSGNVSGVIDSGVIQQVREKQKDTIIVFCSDDQQANKKATIYGAQFVYAIRPMMIVNNFVKDLRKSITKIVKRKIYNQANFSLVFYLPKASI